MVARNPSTRLGRALMSAVGLAALCMMFSSTASAQVWNKKTTVTFTAPVEIPGAGVQVLPAGTYVFQLLDSITDRNVVQIFNEDGSHLYATILAIPNSRLKATDKTVLTFAERPAGDPPALKAWFYPGDRSGQQFVYPRTRALALAAETKEPVLYIPDEAASNFVAPVRTKTEAPVVALEGLPVKALNPSGEDVDVTDVVQAPPVQTAERRLPKTASEMPLLALMGLLSLGLGLSVRRSWATR